MNDDIKSIIDKFLIAFFPRRCALCGKVVAFDKELCNDCINLEHIKSPICHYCGCNKEDCNCKHHKSKYSAIVAPFYYKDSIIGAVHQLKFSSQPLLAVRMGKEIADVIKKEYSDICFDFVTYVPMTKSHQNKREYNQSKLLALEVAKQLDLPLKDVLIKSYNTPSQRLQSSQLRRNNLYGAFECIDNVENKTILIIDDVKTTGSTLNETSRALKLAGSDNVYAAVLAVVNSNSH